MKNPIPQKRTESGVIVKDIDNMLKEKVNVHEVRNSIAETTSTI